MSADGGVVGVSTASNRTTRRGVLISAFATSLVWLLGSAVVVLAQSGSDRKISALAAAAAGIAAIVVLSVLTKDRDRAYIRSLVGATIATSLTSDWMLWHFHVASSQGFQVDGLVKRITLPLLIVLLAPLAARALWLQRSALLRAPRAMDLIVAAYASVVLVPALAVGLYHHNRLLYVAQDLGLIVFFVVMYAAGRAVTADAARASALEIAEALLALAVAKLVLFGWDISPLYSYYEASAAAALAVVLLRPRQARVLPVAVAITLLAYDVVLMKHGTTASTGIELAGALAVLVFLAVRARRLVPQWLVVAVAIVAIVGFVGYTHDGAALRGQYHGRDASAVGTTFEAHQVRASIGHSPLGLALGRGLGGTVDESNAPYWFRITLLSGGRDLAHVQEVHLLPYAILLKEGFIGVAWLAALLVALAIIVFRALERAARDREPALVLYAALPLLGIIQAFAASSRIQADPLNGLALGVLASCLSLRIAPVRGVVRTHRRELVAAALCTLAGCGALMYVGPKLSSPLAPVSQPAASTLPISLWIGDSYTEGAGALNGAHGEAIATSVALGWQTDMDAEGGTGFVARGPRPHHHKRDHHPSEPVPARLPGDASSFPNADVVVIDAGRNDAREPQAKIHRAVVATFKTIAKDYPSSAVVVIAPFLMRSKPGDYLAIRRLEKDQAKKYRWAFVDPIAQGWIDRTSAKLVKRDGIHPNEKGYEYIIAHLAPAIERALARAHEVVRQTCTKTAPCRRKPKPRAR